MRPVTPNDILDLREGIGQVACSFRWDVEDLGGNVQGEVHPHARSAVISNDTRSKVYRTLRGVRLRESEARDLDLFRTVVHPWMVLEDGTRWSLGRFRFTGGTARYGSLETSSDVTLGDARFVLGQTLPRSFGVSDGGSVYGAMLEVAGLYGFPTGGITPTDAVVGGGPATWPPDGNGLQVLESMSQRARYLPPYLDNDGTLTMRPVDQVRLGVGHVYDGRVVVKTLTTSEGLLEAPNAFKVISSGPTKGETYAVAYVDPTAPHSRERRGFTVMKVIRRQGLPDQPACAAVAQSHAAASAEQYATAQLTSAPDPRHDTFDIVQVGADAYREVASTMEMRPGGAHTHTLVKAAVLDE